MSIKSDKWLRRLAPLLGTSPGYLLDHDPNDIDAAFIDMAMRIPPEDRPVAMDLLKALKRHR